MKKMPFLLLAIIASGCVMQKKYDELMAEKLKLESKLDESNEKLTATSARKDSLASVSEILAADTARLNKEIASAKDELGLLNAEHQQLNKHYDNLLNNSGKLNKDLAEQQQSLMEIRENLEKTRQINEQLNADLILREEKVRELENVVQKEKEAANAIKNKINNALLHFEDGDLTVHLKNGKVYVSLAEKLLFKSGSIQVDSKGVEALQQLAKAVKSQSDIAIMVEGHTDNVPISNKQKYFQDNWDLSVLRATSIVRILVESGVAADKISAAGKGEFSPVANNDSNENKQKNRRTEIIITPNLDELFSILNGD